MRAIIAREGRELALAALSVANLAFYYFWHTLLFATQLFLPVWSWADVIAITINVVLLAALLWLVMILAGLHWSVRWIRTLICASTVGILGHIAYLKFQQSWDHLVHGHWIVFLPMVLVAAFLLLRRWRQLPKAAEAFAVMLVAFVPVTFLQAAWSIANQPSAPARYEQAAKPMPASAGANTPGKTVVMIFDQFHPGYLFEDRRPGFEYPAFDRLRNESWYFTDSRQAAVQTAGAVAALSVGKTVYEMDPAGKWDFRLALQPYGKFEKWEEVETLFATLRREGKRSGVVGWHVPYCRLLGDRLDRCHWEAFETDVQGPHTPFVPRLLSQWEYLTPWGPRWRHLQRYERMVSASEQLLRDPQLDAVWLHLPVPHFPAIFNNSTGKFTLNNFKGDWYHDNLALADLTFARLRLQMEAAGEWEDSLVIVTGDHSLFDYPGVEGHSYGPQVPLFIKLPRQKQGHDYTGTVSVLAIHDLILENARRRMSDETLLRTMVESWPAPVTQSAPK